MTIFVYVRIYFARVKNAVLHISQQNSRGMAKIRHRFRKQSKLAKSCFIVVVSFIISQLVVINATFGVLEKKDVYYEIMTERWSCLILFGNSTLNAIVYFWKIKALREEAKVFIRKVAVRVHLVDPERRLSPSSDIHCPDFILQNQSNEHIKNFERKQATQSAQILVDMKPNNTRGNIPGSVIIQSDEGEIHRADSPNTNSTGQNSLNANRLISSRPTFLTLNFVQNDSIS